MTALFHVYLISNIDDYILGEEIVSIPQGHIINTCNHEEADTRIIVHVRDAVQKGAKHISVRTVDTDVVVLLVS